MKNSEAFIGARGLCLQRVFDATGGRGILQETLRESAGLQALLPVQ